MPNTWHVLSFLTLTKTLWRNRLWAVRFFPKATHPQVVQLGLKQMSDLKAQCHLRAPEACLSAPFALDLKKQRCRELPHGADAQKQSMKTITLELKSPVTFPFFLKMTWLLHWHLKELKKLPWIRNLRKVTKTISQEINQWKARKELRGEGSLEDLPKFCTQIRKNVNRWGQPTRTLETRVSSDLQELILQSGSEETLGS